jgi:gliding motility-associated lipoprotein GldH
METIQKNSFFLVGIILFFLMNSCNDNSEFNQYKTVENSLWETNNKIVFKFEVVDTISQKNLFINIRNNST